MSSSQAELARAVQSEIIPRLLLAHRQRYGGAARTQPGTAAAKQTKGSREDQTADHKGAASPSTALSSRSSERQAQKDPCTLRKGGDADAQRISML
ncbi:MAG: hypothetical protein AAGG72_10065, partial [Pseudomonadota bacterium]